MYFYLPKTRTVAAVGLNSQPDSNESKIGDLMDQLFEVLHMRQIIIALLVQKISAAQRFEVGDPCRPLIEDRFGGFAGQ